MANADTRYLLLDSIKQLSPDSSERITRRTLTDADRMERLPFTVSLKMRNFEDLEARLGRGLTIPLVEMESNFLPSLTDYADLQAWLVAQGFEVTQQDPNHTNLFMSGTVAQIETSLGVTFAKVTTQNGEFTSAITAPSLPIDFLGSVLAISGLQPHIRMPQQQTVHAQAVTDSNGAQYVTPFDILAAYKAPASLTGKGQTIAVIYPATVLASDLSMFYSTIGSTQTANNVTTILLGGGPIAPTNLELAEAAQEIEWAGGMAPGAKVRLYAVKDLAFTSFIGGCSQILADAAANHITVVSILYFDPESHYTASVLQSFSQVFAQMAAAGITVVAGSGDGGSNPNTDLTNGYSPSNPLQAGYPATDPYVTAVGGTIMTFASGTFADAGETAWTRFPPTGPISGDTNTDLASGGGVSSVFARPVWQTDGGPILTNAYRCVPDISVACSEIFRSANIPRFSAFGILNGQVHTSGAVSLATPIFAGIVALLNQARANAGLNPIGLLGPAIYLLHGTSAFNDITSGSNGAYSAGVGYDLVTGLGTPNIANLAALLTDGTLAASAPPNVTVDQNVGSLTYPNGGSGITLRVSTSNGPVGSIYQWYLNGAPIGEARSASLTIYPTAATAGDYTCTVTNYGGSTTVDAGTFAVTTSAWLVNLSARAFAQTGAGQLIAGFVTTGPNNKSLLIRGSGPAMGSFGITDYLADPQLTFLNGSGTIIATNSAWNNSLSSTFGQVGAFALTPGSRDTALLQSVAPGAYTAQVVSQTTNNGVALAEIYDADSGAPANRLVNISARANVGIGSDILIGGFVIGGTTPLTVIIRAVGPTLSPAFGLAGTLPSPVLSLYNSAGTLIASNTGWSSDPVVTANGGLAAQAVQTPNAVLFAKVGAFAFSPTMGSIADSAMVVTLPPGGYTAQVSGANNATGIALMEIYELR